MGTHNVTVNLVHIGHVAEHPGPGDARREHNSRCSVTSLTSIEHATAINDDEERAVLLVHTGHDAEHLRPVDKRRENCAPDHEEREQNPCPQRRIRTPEEECREEDLGSFLFFLFFFFLPRPFWRSTCLRRTTSLIRSGAGDLEKPKRTSFMCSTSRSFASASSRKASAEASTGCSTICSTGTSRARTSS